jgi:cell division protein FtsZ
MADAKRYVPEHAATIKVIGLGRRRLQRRQPHDRRRLDGVDFYAINTDVQALRNAKTNNTVQIGSGLTRGLGAGANPNIGREAADESREDLAMILDGADLVFITAGMGGGTGTGAAPVVAELARESGALTVAVVTKPFAFEGRKRMQAAERGIADLESKVDTLITIPNERILQIIEKRTPLNEAFAYADDVLRQGIQGISDLITQPGLINLDFADVKTIMTDAGSAMMGIGEGSGEHRAADAAQKAIASPLLETTIEGARGVIFNITGGPDLSMYEVNEAAEMIARAVDSEAQIIFGASIDPQLQGKVRVTVLAAGFGSRPHRPSAAAIGGTMEFEKVSPVNMDDIEVPAFLRYRSFGRAIAREFHEEGVAFVVVDSDEPSLAEAAADGATVVSGNAADLETLKAAGVERARALVTAVDNDADNLYVTLSARVLKPDLFIVARANRADAEPKLRLAGANRVVSPYAIGGRRLASLAMRPTAVEFVDTILSANNGELLLEDMTIPPASRLAGHSLADLVAETDEALVLAMKRAGAMLFRPAASTVLQEEDELVIAGPPAAIAALEMRVRDSA